MTPKIESFRPDLKSILFIALSVFFFTGFFSGCTKQETIVNGLSEKEANEIIVVLDSVGIDAQKVKAEGGGGGGGGDIILWNIVVTKDEATKAMAFLNSQGLPRRKGQDLLSLFKAGGLVPSEMEEKIRFLAGQEEQLATTIRKFDGVIDADVRLSIPEEDPLNPAAEKPKPSASVYVKHQGILDDPNSRLISKIRFLVSGSVQDLEFDNVTVIPDRARFTDLARGDLGAMKEQKTFVKVWTVIVAKESVGRFRAIFFTFTILILLLILSVVWMGWKLFPLLMESGGLSQLLSLKPISSTGEKPAKDEEEDEEEEAKEEDDEESEDEEEESDEDDEEDEEEDEEDEEEEEKS